MKIRPYREEDIEAICALFYQTVHAICKADYTHQQLDAWADGMVSQAEWNASFLAHTTFVAEQQKKIVGFADMSDLGYLDRLYVHQDDQRQGIATCLCEALERKVPCVVYTTHASLTAQGFFEHIGYRAIETQEVLRKGVVLCNVRMEKRRRTG